MAQPIPGTECDAPDCTEPAARYCDGYCSDVCRNVDLQVAARQIDKGLDADVTDDEIQTIRDNVDLNHQLIESKIQAAIDD